MAGQRHKFDCFISYATEDLELAVADIIMAMFEAGISMWADRLQIFPSESIPQAIDKGIQDSRYLVPIVTNKYFTKSWTSLELSAVRMLSKPIIPVWVDVSAKAVTKFSPLLVQHKAIIYDADPHKAAEQIANVLMKDRSTNFYKSREGRELRAMFWMLVRIYVDHIVTGKPFDSPDWVKLDGIYAERTGSSLPEQCREALGMNDFDITERVRVLRLVSEDRNLHLSDEQVSSIIIGEGKRKSDTWFPRDPREDEALHYLGLHSWN